MSEKKKVFISQPINDKSDEEVKSEKKRIIAKLHEKYGDNIEIIDSFIKNAPEGAKPLWFLGESIKILSTADIAVFAKGWESARGCKMEHEACVKYGIEIREM